jgi:F420-non-reducing hydrogenase iron-sulfur subunit
MAQLTQTRQPKILILATLAGGYAGADSTGQSHLDYPANTYILHGIDGIIVMYSGTDSPYKVEADGTAKLINQAYGLMKERGIDIRRLRLAAICTVCVKPFLKEVNQMNELLKGIGFVKDELGQPAVALKGA